MTAGKTLLVIGLGTVGLSAIMAAKTAHAGRIIAVDIIQSRLDLAIALGATDAVHAREQDLVTISMNVSGFGVDFAIDSTGVPDLIRQAIEVLAPRGICGIVGASPPNAVLPIDLRHVLSGGRKVIGIIEGDSDPDVFIPLLIGLYRRGVFPFDRLMKFYEFDDINKAIADSETGKTIKPVIHFNSTPLARH